MEFLPQNFTVLRNFMRIPQNSAHGIRPEQEERVAVMQEIILKFQAKQLERNLTDKAIALATDTPTSTFSRYWTGKTRPPHEFVERVADFLKVPLDDEEKLSREEAINVTQSYYAEKIAEKDDLIASLKAENAALRKTITEKDERMLAISAEHAQRIDRLSAETKEREDRKNRIILNQSRTITILSVILAAVTVFLVYFILDAFNGNWGLVRYIMEIIPDPSHGADSGREFFGGITGLWNRL